MKILLSAYACEPGKGSEPGVGWNWAKALAAKGYKVWVLTRANNRSVIEDAFANRPQPGNLHFLYYDLPSWARWWKKGNHGVHLYYLLWQWGAYRVARKAHAVEKFDLVHHVTFVSARQPSFMGNLGIPFIFGPVAGGEKAPWRLRLHYGLRGWLKDAIRDGVNLAVRFDPFMRRTFRQAERIFVTSEQTGQLLPVAFRPKMKTLLAIGIGEDELRPSPPADRCGTFKVLYVGQFLYWKGMGLGIRAFARFSTRRPDAHLTMVGRGPERQRWQKLAKELGIADKIRWLTWREREELAELYVGHDLFLYPSLHDSGAMVVLEALAHGLPTVCLDIGGPGELTTQSCGKKIPARQRSPQQVISDLAAALEELHDSKAERKRLSHGALERAKELSWPILTQRIYGENNRFGSSDSTHSNT